MAKFTCLNKVRDTLGLVLLDRVRNVAGQRRPAGAPVAAAAAASDPCVHGVLLSLGLRSLSLYKIYSILYDLSTEYLKKDEEYCIFFTERGKHGQSI